MPHSRKVEAEDIRTEGFVGMFYNAFNNSPVRGFCTVTLKRATLILLLLGCTIGCTRWEVSLRRDHWDAELRGLSQAAMREQMPRDPRLADFDYNAGWRAGYERVLRGGDFDPPLAPPPEYFDPLSRREGQTQRVCFWHDGFVAGVAVAREVGVEKYFELPSGSPRPEATLQSPFYTADLTAQTDFATETSPTNLPSPLPPIIDEPTAGRESTKPSESQSVMESKDAIKQEGPSPSDRKSAPSNKPPVDQEPNKAKLLPPEPEVISPLAEPVALRAAEIIDLKSSEQAVPNESVDSLDQAAGELRASGWMVPLPPPREGRVAERPQPLTPRPLSPWR